MELSFRELADTAPVLIWMGDARGNCTYLSRSWYLFTGQDPEAADLRGWIEAVHPDDRPNLLKTFHSARDKGQSYQVEYRVRQRSGDYHWMLDSAAPRFTNDGEMVGYIGSIVDNQQRKQAEVALEKSERRARIAAEAAGLGIWEWDLASNVFEFSPRAAEIFGFLPNKPLSFAQIHSVMHPEDLPEVLRLSAQALDPAQRRREPYKYRISRASDGVVRWIEAHGEALFPDEGSGGPQSYIGTFQDITEQVRAASTLQQSEARLRLALEAGGLAVWELDVVNDTLAHSPELNALYGLDRDARPSVSDFRARYAPGEQERLEALGAEARARGETQLQAEINILWPDGAPKWLFLQAHAAPPLEHGGPRVIGVVMDITQRKLSEERLATVAQELQHRVKNSLAVVQTLASQSFRAGRSREEALESFSQRLAALAQTTDAMTRNDWLDADLHEIVQRVTKPYRDAGSDPFVLEGPHVPVASTTAIAIGMALHELCTNAVKYGALSISTGQVLLSWTSVEDAIEITWRETGGPPVKAPTGGGFGTRLLRRGLFTEPGSKVDLEFAEAGLQCRIRLPQAELNRS